MKIAKFELSYYVYDEDPDFGEQIMDAAEAIICPDNSDESPDHVCRLIAGSIQVMTEEQYDEWFDRNYPEE